MLAVSLAAGLALSAGGAALAAPAGMLKQFKVPTARSEPFSITNGSDGNRWFTEGTGNTGSPAKIARITPGGAITEFVADGADGCNGCLLTDIAQGPGGILYITTNSATLLRFNVSTGSFGSAVPVTGSGSFNRLAVGGGNVWITDFTNDAVWRVDIATENVTSTPFVDPDDVAVDTNGNAWVTDNNDSIVELGPTGTVISTTTTTVPPDAITVTNTNQVWFTSAVPATVGHLTPGSPNTVELFPLADTRPLGIAASPNGSVWFTQNATGNIANINAAGVITEGKVVKSSDPVFITVADNGNPWYTMRADNKIATLQLR